MQSGARDKGKFLHNAICTSHCTHTVTAQQLSFECLRRSPGQRFDLFKVLKRSPISRPHALGIRRSCSDGKARGSTTGLRRRLHPYWKVSLLQSLYRALGQTEASSNIQVLTRSRFELWPPLGHTSGKIGRPHVRENENICVYFCFKLFSK